MKLNKAMLTLTAAGLLASAASYAGDISSAVQAEAQVQVTSQLAVSHTLTPETFNSGKVPDDAVVARGAVVLTSGGNISSTNLAWNRTVNPADAPYLKGFGDRAAMRDTTGHNEVWVHLVPVTAAAADVNLTSVNYRLSSPAPEFDYTVSLVGGINEMKPGTYNLAVVAQVETA